MKITLDGQSQFFWQWDTARRVILDCASPGVAVEYTHNGKSGDCYREAAYEEAGIIYAKVPDVLLQKNGFITVYVRVGTTAQGQTVHSTSFRVRWREKPADYVCGDDEVKTWDALGKRIDALDDIVTAMIVAIDYGSFDAATGQVKATHTVAEIKSHYDAGGVVLFDTGTGMLNLAKVSSSGATFVGVTGYSNAYDLMTYQIDADSYVTNTALTLPPKAEAGQVLAVAAVDGNGRPTLLQTVDLPEVTGTEGAVSYAQAQELTEAQQMQARANLGLPHKSETAVIYVEDSTVTLKADGVLFANYSIDCAAYPDWLEGQQYTVVWDGETYEVIARQYKDKIYLGNLALAYNGAESNGLPFYIDYWMIGGTSAGDHVYSIAGATPVYHPLETEYIPMTVPRAAAAAVGQTIVVKAVDDNGKPTEWEAADLPEDDGWELINDITLVEQVSAFHITEDLNGNPFALRKYLLAVAWAPVTDGSTIPGFMFLSENNVTSGQNAPLVYTSGLPAASDSGVMGGYLLTELLPDHTIKQESWRGQNPTIGGANLDPFAALKTGTAKIHQCLGRKDSFEPFFEIGGTNGLLAVGSKIKLWGVRA